MILADAALARRLEEADARAGALFARTLAQLRPGTAAIAEEVAGGYAVYAGVGSPLTQAAGLGMAGSVREGDLDRVEAFYRARGVVAAIVVCPLADRSLHETLAARGYLLSEFDNVLVRDLERAVPSPAPPEGLTIARAAAEEIDLWVKEVAGGFAPPREVSPAFLGVFETFGRMPGSTPFLARLQGRTAGGGLVSIDRGLARLSVTSTLPEFRGRGVHRALLQARLGFAAAAGCDLATLAASPGSVSQRNAERQGFRVAYTRARMALDHRGGSEMLLQY